MKTIKTMYRDITYEEVCRVHHMLLAGDDSGNWQRRRGQPIEIITPPDAYTECGEPTYDVKQDPAGHEAFACSHIAEIGD